VLLVRETASRPRRAQDFPNEFPGGSVVVNDKNLCRHVSVPRPIDSGVTAGQ